MQLQNWIKESPVRMFRDLQRIEQAMINIGETKQRLPLNVMLNITEDRREILNEINCLQIVKKGCKLKVN